MRAMKPQNRSSLIPRPLNARLVAGVIPKPSFHQYIWAFLLSSLGVILALAVMRMPASAAPDPSAPIHMVQAWRADESNRSNPSGLAYSSRANAFLAVQSPAGTQPAAETELVTLTSFGRRAGELGSQSTPTTTASQSDGQIVELSMAQTIAPAAAAYTSSLVNTVDLAAVWPPSPDPSGLAYVTASNHLVMDDGEVEEKIMGVTNFEGANVWTLTLAGGVVDTANLSSVPPDQTGMTNEPTGITWNPNNGHFFITDDNATEVYDLDPGSDGQIGTSDDSWTSFDTSTAGSGDPEGITFDTWNNRLFVADGVNQEVYQFTLTGNLVSHFDVGAYGVVDPESVAFNPYTGTLYIMGSEKDVGFAVETDTNGNLLQLIDLSAAGPRTAAGLAFAPASNGSGAWRLYIVDRGVDNNVNPDLIDGKMYEMTVPASTGPDNNAPAAANNAYATDEDVPLSVPAPGILGNDNDADGDTIIPILVSGVSNGNLVLHPNGSFTYTPGEDFNGSDSFTYKANDSAANSNTATVTITVNSVNDAPKADANGPYTGTIGQPVQFDASGSTDVDGTITTYAWDFGDGDTGSGPNPTHIYTTIDTFTVVLTVTDNNGASDVDESTANIKDAPNQAPAAGDNAYTTNEDAALSVNAPGVLANDNDPDGDPISAVLVSNAANGSVSLYPDGDFVYFPNADYYGTDSFTYKAYDGEDYSNTATVTLTVDPVNDPPTAEANGPYSGTAGAPVQFDAAGSGDIDGSIMTYAWDFGDGGSASGPAPTHTYAAGGTHTVTLTVTDDGGATGTTTTSATIQATPNQAPTAGDDAYSTHEGEGLNVPAPGVLANDNDPDGNALIALKVTDVSHGSLNLLTDGSFTYTPNAGFSGTDTFFYRADDGAAHSGTATVTISIDPVNETPQVTITSPSDGATFAPGAATFFTATASDAEDGDLSAGITWSSSLLGTLGTGSSYAAILPDGSHTITASVTDSDGASAADQVIITVGAQKLNFLPIVTTGVNSIKSNSHGAFGFARRLRPRR